jgi:hypothetical protein
MEVRMLSLHTPDRRTFLGTAIAGAIPLAFQGSKALLAQAPASDPVLDHIGREFAGAYNRLKSRGMARGEDLRIVATNLRLFLARGSELRLDARLQRSVRRRIAREGREAVLNAVPDDATLIAIQNGLKEYGVTVTVDEVKDSFVRIPWETRTRALTELETVGMSRTLFQAAATAERLARALDAQQPTAAHGGARVVLVQSPGCAELLWQIDFMVLVGAAMALTAPMQGFTLIAAAYALRRFYYTNC